MIGFVIAGTHSGVGKTTITAGVMKCLMNRGHQVQPFKSGPDYIDPAFHSFVTKKTSRNLDAWMLPEAHIRYLFGRHSEPVDAVVVEGVMGLFDGYGTENDCGSSAHLSKTLNLPVILVIDGSGMSASAAALVKGFACYDPAIQLAGVIVNKVSGHHYELIKEAIERDTGIPCLGYMSKNPSVRLESRHLGLVPAGEVESLSEIVDNVAQLLAQSIDFDLLEQVCQIEKPLVTEHPLQMDLNRFKGLRIGVASDSAFNFYYKDNLDLFEDLGCTLHPFSPISDAHLPENLDMLYFGGGFPEVFGKQLSENSAMKNAVKEAAEAGLPIYAECGGLMYLTENIVDLKNESHSMVGIFEGKSVMTTTLKRFGYVEVTANESLFGKAMSFKAHEFHRSQIEDSTEESQYEVFKFKGTSKQRGWHCGYAYKNVLGAYAHVHFYNNLTMCVNLLETVKKHKENHYDAK